jgi:hypothetical protein
MALLTRLAINPKFALSNDVSMSAPKDSKRGSGRASDDQGVLSKLPRTRPQRSSPRRAAAREASAAAEAASTVTALSARSNGRPPAHPPARPPARPKKAPARSAAAPRRVRAASARGAKASPSPAAEPVPRQGFECESERTSATVHPPGGAELVASAAEIVGELAKAGFATGERLLKDVLSRLPLS